MSTTILTKQAHIMWTSSNYWTAGRIASVPVIEQVNMLTKHANRQGMSVQRFDVSRDNCVFARLADNSYFTLACIGRWMDEEDEQSEHYWGINR